MYRQRDKYHQLRLQFDAMDHIIVREDALIGSTAYTGSLHETARRQNIRRSLTNVSDTVFLFFCMVESKRADMETPTALQLYGGNVVSICADRILQDETLIAQWFEIYQGISFDNDTVLSLFKDICRRYLYIANNQYRKRMVECLGKKKKLAHRVEVQKRKSQSATTKDQKEVTPSTSQQKTSKGSKKKGKGKSKAKKSRRDLSCICRVCDDEYKKGIEVGTVYCYIIVITVYHVYAAKR